MSRTDGWTNSASVNFGKRPADQPPVTSSWLKKKDPVSKHQGGEHSKLSSDPHHSSRNPIEVTIVENIPKTQLSPHDQDYAGAKNLRAYVRTSNSAGSDSAEESSSSRSNFHPGEQITGSSAGSAMTSPKAHQRDYHQRNHHQGGEELQLRTSTKITPEKFQTGDGRDDRGVDEQGQIPIPPLQLPEIFPPKWSFDTSSRGVPTLGLLSPVPSPKMDMGMRDVRTPDSPNSGELELSPVHSDQKSDSPCELEFPKVDYDEKEVHVRNVAPTTELDNLDRLTSPLPEDFWMGSLPLGDPRRYSNLIFERAQNFLLGVMAQNSGKDAEGSVRNRTSPFLLASQSTENDGDSRAGGSSSGVPEQLGSPVSLSGIPEVEGRFSTPSLDAGGIPEDREADFGGRSVDGTDSVRSGSTATKTAGIRKLTMRKPRWREDESCLELSFKTNDAGDEESVGTSVRSDLKYSDRSFERSTSSQFDEAGKLETAVDCRVVVGRKDIGGGSENWKGSQNDGSPVDTVYLDACGWSSGTDDPDTAKAVADRQHGVTGRPPRPPPNQSQLDNGGLVDGAWPSMMDLERLDSQDLFRNCEKFRSFVKHLQSIAKTGSMGQMRRVLGVGVDAEEVRNGVKDGDEGGEKLPVSLPVAQSPVDSNSSSQSRAPVVVRQAGVKLDSGPGLVSRSSSEGVIVHGRNATEFMDAEDSGPAFWEEETKDEVNRMVTEIEMETSDHEQSKGQTTVGFDNEELLDSVRRLNTKQVAKFAEQLREVMNTSKLSIENAVSETESGHYTKSDSSCGPPSSTLATKLPVPNNPRKAELVSPFEQSSMKPETIPAKSKVFTRVRSRSVDDNNGQPRRKFQFLSGWWSRRRKSKQSSDFSSPKSSQMDILSDSHPMSDIPTGRKAQPGPLVTEASASSEMMREVSRALEPHGSGSAILPPHGLEDVMSIRQAGLQESQNLNMEDFGIFTPNGEFQPHDGAVGGGAHKKPSLEERFYKLKSMYMGMPPVFEESSSIDNPFVDRTVTRSVSNTPSFKSSLSMDTINPHEVSEDPVPPAYRPTNDISQILRESKLDVARNTGPLSIDEWEFLSKFSGKWKIDRGVSDTQDELCKIMALGWVFRKGLENTDTMIFEMSHEMCKSIAKVVGVVSLVEKRPWTGGIVEHRRRDLRRGISRCWAERYDGGFIMRMDWDDPLGGTSYEFCEMSADLQTMVIRQDFYRKVDGASIHMKTVLRRA